MTWKKIGKVVYGLVGITAVASLGWAIFNWNRPATFIAECCVNDLVTVYTN